MNVAITGATGYLGSALASLLLRRGASVLSLGRRSHPSLTGRPSFVEARMDQAAEALREFAPSALIHAAAMASAEACERSPGDALAANVTLTEAMERAAGRARIPLIFVSTDLVFSGERAPAGGFPTDHPVSPRSVYSETKAKAEEIVRQRPENCVVRSSLLFGPSAETTAGPLGWMARSVRDGSRIMLFEDEWRTPIAVDEAAEALMQCAARGARGVIHCGGRDRVNRVQFGTAFVAALGGDRSLIDRKKRSEVPSVPARPEDVSLNISSLNEALGLVPRSFEESMRLVAAQWRGFVGHRT